MTFTSIYVDALIFGYIKNRNTVSVIQNGIRGGDCNWFPILHTIRLIQISPRSGTWQIWKKSLTYLYPRIQALYLLKPSEVLSSSYTFQFPSRKPFNIQSTPVFLLVLFSKVSRNITGVTFLTLYLSYPTRSSVPSSRPLTHILVKI